MTWRLRTLIVFFAFLYAFLIFNIYNLQINKSSIYVKLAESQELAASALDAVRGNIYFTDKNMNPAPAALNKEFEIIFAVPTEIQQIAEVEGIPLSSIAEKLSAIVGKPAQEIEKQISRKDDQFELLVRKATEGEVRQIKDADIKGVYITGKDSRFYPSAGLAAHVLGFVSLLTDNKSQREIETGRYGIELFFNKLLAGKSGEAKGDTITQPVKGSDVNLTIDRNIQSQAEEILKGLIEERGAEAGTVIVLEPKTGKILAMGSFPNFDPNNYSKSNIKDFLNPAVQAVYEPGSIFKVLTMAAGIDSGKITTSTTYIDTGLFTANGRTISNWDLTTHGAYGKVTMTSVIEHSINTGAVFAERQTGHDIFYNYLVKFGLNEPTGITLPGEVRGSLNNLKKGKDIDFATAAYGQGVSVTPVGLISAISAIANNGVLMRPYISADDQPQVIRRVISEKTAKTVTQMMVSAVDKNQVAAIPNYSLAGKTGTAFIPIFGGKGYSDEVINTYVGFGPASDAKFIILIKLDKPAGGPVAALTVVPAFRDLAQSIINYYNIGPDKLVVSQ